MGARPIDDLAIGLDQRIQLLLQRSDLVGLSSPSRRSASPERIAARFWRMARKGERPKRTWKKVAGDESEPEHCQCGDQHGGEFGEIAVDLRGVTGDGIGIGRGVRAGRA